MQQNNKLLGFLVKILNLAPNSTYTLKDYSKLVLEASKHDTYMETVNQEQLPNADSMHYLLLRARIDKMRRKFRRKAAKLVRRTGIRHAVVIIDYTHEPFFGRSESEYIHEYKPRKGCRGSFAFLCMSILCGDRRLFVDAVPFRKDMDEAEAVREMLEWLMKVTRIEIVLVDRGFARSSYVLDELNSLKVSYLGLYPKYRNVKKLMEPVGSSCFLKKDFEVRGVGTGLVILNDGKHVWTFVTNINRERFVRYVQIYRKRWNVETGFRVQDEARIRTKSIRIEVRYFLFLASMVLYNTWKSLGIPGSFKRFVLGLLGKAIAKVVTKIIPGIP